MGGQLQTTIFISHSSHDVDGPLRLADDLKRAGLNVWVDEREIGVGDRVTSKIELALQGSAYVAIWLTRAAVESRWVESEWQSKFDTEISSGRVTILPLLAEDCEIPYFLRGKRFADFRKDYTKGLAELLKVVGIKDWVSPTGMKFTLILPGTFVMGSDNGEENERPPHQVVVTHPYYIGTYVVTQRDWRKLMGTSPWRGVVKVREGDNFPAVNITWPQAQEYFTQLSAQDRDNSYYLPTEEEWEYAARAGTTTNFSFGDDKRDMRLFGWYRDMTYGREEYAHEVGQKRPNPWGLYDVHGNIWEWTDNWYYGSYSARPKLNPPEKVLRGGGWDYPADGARSAFRNILLPSRSTDSVGFRLIRKPAQA
jgi:formylglycine-generating enzyme required for sulfatase activity